MPNPIALLLAILVVTASMGLLVFTYVSSGQQQPAPSALESVLPAETLSDASLSQDAEGHTIPYTTQEQIAMGLILLADNCSPCHATGPTGDSARDGAPPFRTLHERYDVSLLSEALVEGLVAHPEMPEFQFTPTDAESVILYLQWLNGDLVL